MYTIRHSNVGGAFRDALLLLKECGDSSTSRNGEVVRVDEPVSIHYRKPWQRVLNSPIRNANPFFHFMESLWMLAGRSDVAFPALFNKRMREYSDDGKTFWGAYGHRWRNFFSVDQINSIVVELNAHPDSRRAVLGMWSPDDDPTRAAKGGKDVPCNTHAYFDLRGGKLNMTVCNRSNDALWGAFGANAVHFSYLQQYIAECLGVPMGWYEQVTNNLHVYTDVLPRETWEALQTDLIRTNLYIGSGKMLAPSHALFTHAGRFATQLNKFIDAAVAGNTVASLDYTEPTIRDIAVPMLHAWQARNSEKRSNVFIEDITAWDWRIACRDWLVWYRARRALKLETKA